LEKEPSDRYASAAELADDMYRYRGGELIHARGFSLADRVARTLNRTEQAKQFRVLGALLRWIAPIPFTMHALALALWRRTTYYDVAAVLTTLTTIVFLLGLVGR